MSDTPTAGYERGCGATCRCETRFSDSQECMYDHLGNLLPHRNTGRPDTVGEGERKRTVGVCRSCCRAWPCHRAGGTRPHDDLHVGPVPNVGIPALLDYDDEPIPVHIDRTEAGR